MQLRRTTGRLTRFAFRAVATGAAQFTDSSTSKPPSDTSVLEDIAMKRPWNIAVKATRALARTHKRHDGVTAVIVSWNTAAVVADVLAAIQRRTPDLPILVVDNGSTDGSRQMLRSRRGIARLLLPANAGHGVALDLAMHRVGSTIAVVLDSDAIPLRDDWLAPVVEPIRHGAVLAGTRSSRDFVHPMFMAVDVDRFVQRRLSFQVHKLASALDEERWGENCWDTGELLTLRVDPGEVVFVEATDNPVPGLPGMTAGDVVYHHGGVSRGRHHASDLKSWKEAVRALS